MTTQSRSTAPEESAAGTVAGSVRRRPRVPFRSRLLLASLLVSAVVAGLLTWVMHFVLERNQLSSVSIATAVGAVELSAQLDATMVQRVAAATPAGARASGPDADQLRSLLLRSRDRILREFPPWLIGDPRQAVARLGVVVRGDVDDRARLLISSDGLGENEPYRFAQSDFASLRWDAMSFDEWTVQNGRGECLGGRAPIRDGEGRTVGLALIESDARFLHVLDGLLVEFCLVVFLATLVVSFAMASTVSSRLVRPVQQLDAAMARVRTGDLSVKVKPMHRGDEFDALTSRFNEMVGGLQERERMQHDLRLAGQVQDHLLPRTLPRTPGYDVLYRVVYCEQTGGDYVDLLELREGLLGMALGDVSGHGVPAAMLTGYTKALVRAIAPGAASDASAVLRAINSHLVRDTGDNTFITLFYAVLEMDGHALRWTSGGHDPAMVVRADGRVERLDSTDIPLGLDLVPEFPAGRAVAMRAGDVFFVATDGLAQSRDTAGEYFGFGRIESLLAARRGEPLDRIAEAVLEAARVHRGPRAQDDDIAFLLVRRRDGLGMAART